MSSAQTQPLHCSFCGKDRSEVAQIILGPLVCICDGCVEACVEIIREKVGKRAWHDAAFQTIGSQPAQEALT